MNSSYQTSISDSNRKEKDSHDSDRHHRSSHSSHKHRDRSRSPESRSHRDRDDKPSSSKPRSRSRSSSPKPKDDSERRSRKKQKRRRDEYGSDSASEGEDQPHPKLLKFNVDPLDSNDYFQKSAELKAWLASGSAKSSGKKLYLDEMKSKDARKWFGRFCKAWNRGELIDAFYQGQIRTAASSASSQTRHKWNFTSTSTYTSKEKETLESIRDSVDTLTNSTTRGAIEARELERKIGKGKRMTERDGESNRASGSASGSGSNVGARDQGWGSKSELERPGAHSSDIKYQQELKSEFNARKRAEERRAENRDLRDEREELFPKATGRDAKIEKRRDINQSNRKFEERGDDGLEVNEDVLMGNGGDFAAALASRDQPKHQRNDKRAEKAAERKEQRVAEQNERFSTLKAKESSTMEMFKQLAAQRFGGGSS